LAATVAVIALLLSGFVVAADDAGNSGDWTAPPRASRRCNPIPADDRSRSTGRAIYVRNCLACHGPRGRGDGPSAASCEPPPSDLCEANVVHETDGALFWKITAGRKPMPSYQSQLTDEQRWHLVNYLRALAPAPASQPVRAGKP
jgi:mono/diheme cytochrome c family protein